MCTLVVLRYNRQKKMNIKPPMLKYKISKLVAKNNKNPVYHKAIVEFLF